MQSSLPLPPSLYESWNSSVGGPGQRSLSAVSNKALAYSHRIQGRIEERNRVPRIVCEVWLQHILQDTLVHGRHANMHVHTCKAHACHQIVTCMK